MTSNNNKNYIEVSKEGTIDKKKAFFFKSSLIIILLLLIIIPFNIKTYSKYSSEVSSNNTLRTAKWMFKVNGSSDNLNINLEDTITNNISNRVVPGSEGKIDLVIDFSGSEVASKYVISKDENSFLPDNLKLYTDSNYANEFSSISSNVGLDSIDEVLVITLYWKWNIDNEDESSLMGKDINLILKVDLSEAESDLNE